MKAILKFDLSDPDDALAHLRCIKSLDMALVLWTIATNTKKNLMFDIVQKEEKNGKLEYYEIVDIIYQRIYEILNEYDIDVDKLIV